MVNNIQDQNSSDPQHAILDQMRIEAATITNEAERLEQEQLIAELAGELALSEQVRNEADAAVERAKAMASKAKTKNQEKTSARKYNVDMNRIGWISSEGVEPIEIEHISTESIEEDGYFFGSIVEKDSVANDAMEELEKQNIADSLLEILKTTKIPQLWNDIKNGGSTVRSISVGKKRGRVNPHKSLNTSYPAYKVGVQGTNNRAILIIGDERVDEKPVIILVAMFDHDDEDKIFRHMNLVSNPSKGRG